MTVLQSGGSPVFEGDGTEPETPLPRRTTTIHDGEPMAERPPLDPQVGVQARLEHTAHDDRVYTGMIIGLRTQGFTNPEIAQTLGIDVRRVRRLARQARTEGRLGEVLDALQHEALPQAVDNLIEKLEEKDWDATKATLHGLGAFRTHTAMHGVSDGGGQNRLEVVFQMPAVPIPLDPKAIIGAPRTMEVIDATVHPGCVEGPIPQDVRPGEAGRDEPGGREGEDQGGRLARPARTSLLERLARAQSSGDAGAASDE